LPRTRSPHTGWAAACSRTEPGPENDLQPVRCRARRHTARYKRVGWVSCDASARSASRSAGFTPDKSTERHAMACLTVLSSVDLRCRVAPCITLAPCAPRVVRGKCLADGGRLPVALNPPGPSRTARTTSPRVHPSGASAPPGRLTRQCVTPVTVRVWQPGRWRRARRAAHYLPDEPGPLWIVVLKN
jgi:hypothetical protein